ncbi:hypothetical protein [Amycolatopsis sp. NBC_00438]|uniref:hypothetical protein n=1 Tax=Amycolatopsis sp. NBC_00438 TaxID=2903558 RepID=UPI002E232E03
MSRYRTIDGPGFADTWVAGYRATSHPIDRAPLEGFVATAAVLARRGGGAAGPDRLAELVAEYGRARPA